MGNNEKPRKKGPGVMNVILIIVGVLLIIFTVEMIREFRLYGSIPDTLCTCVFAVLGGECGVMGWIKTTKERNKQRENELEDREYYDKKNKPSDQPGGETEENNE
ncbi:hypothetical protein [uncultured Ruminococcus sp.]|uniref:hypothetical protein n=1 Tax=uncultured Ruminococcus sp. TaxID=165186 RepID=UPI0025D4B84C|nr:hypothetical protein [uncultured Ruminococcus sp.]